MLNLSLYFADGKPILTQMYNFAENDSIVCQNITLSQLTQNQHRNRDIKLEIDPPSRPVYQVGRVSSAIVTIKTGRDPTTDGGSGKDGDDKEQEGTDKEGTKDGGCS